MVATRTTTPIIRLRDLVGGRRRRGAVRRSGVPLAFLSIREWDMAGEIGGVSRDEVPLAGDAIAERGIVVIAGPGSAMSCA